MSRAARKNKPSRKQAKPHHVIQPLPATSRGKIQNPKLVFIIITILAAIPFSIGKYFEFNSPGPFDSGAYVYSAKHIVDGAKIGEDEKPSAQPATLLVNMLGVWAFGFSETGPELMQMILQAAAMVLMFIAMAKLFGTLPAAVGVIVASVYLSAPLIAKFGNVKEQYMIAFMVMGISCFVLRQLKGQWWWAVLAGAFVGLAPLFKQTGVSAIAAISLFVIAQPFLKNKTWKQTAADTGLLLTGSVAALIPVYTWLLIANAPKSYMPYWFALKLLFPADGTTITGSYVTKSREVIPFAKQWPRVLRYYWLLRLPIALAAGAIIAKIMRMLLRLKVENRKSKIENHYGRFVLLFAVWWILDMAFVWISPRSYEQYYLPLNASAAMLGGYLIAVYRDAFSKSAYKGKWGLIGTAGLVCMIIMSWHIFFGIEKSPHSGADYGRKRRGYAQKLNEISQRRRDNLKGHWELVGEYIREHSVPSDKIYVWGWYPGIYVKAQRLSPAAKAFTSEMHVKRPQELSEMIVGLLDEFEEDKPKFIVDSRKQHFPWDRPPLELWPRTPKGFLPADKQIINAYDTAYSKMLHNKIEPDEAKRFKAMRPFREFVMKNYKIVQSFGPHILFQLKNPPG